MNRNFSFICLVLILSYTGIVSAEVGGLNCIQIEGLNLGCVSSVDHVCKMNKSSDLKIDCAYGAGWASRWRVEGPIAFACKSYKITTIEEKIPAKGCCPGMACVPGDTCVAAHVNKVTSSECESYQPPSCAESCVGCYEDVQTFNVGISRGCTICTRQACADEPPASAYCPAHPPMVFLGQAKKCSTDERCPATAIDPLGNIHTVIKKSSCNIGPAPTPPSPGVIGKYCPWKLDSRTGGSAMSDGGTPASSGKCECITEENWNLNAGPWPGCPPSVGP